ncbi:DNA (cytosine-5)-methyltransferase 1 [Burkholderia cepacia]|uniref:DNA cytosine methyltransferase n=1 Tax=Burkholderia cepacia TaxID=292 RepID=UPI0008BEBD83|nr:DNA cytosine methyltransferase [Burkholderia cepacia]SEU40294.1 DNA (cytosine-5)-methyltransferase 1 [Burkholderia cepacia]
MKGYFVKNIGANRGKPRIWLQGLELEKAGFQPGASYEIDVKGNSVVLTVKADGTRIVSPKKVRERTLPVIDLNSKALLAIFDGMAAVRVIPKDGEIYIVPLASEIKKQERFQRLREKLEQGEPLAIGSLSHGGGILTHAIHEGLRRAGIDAKLAFANDIRPELIEHASQNNDAWSHDTVPLAAPMQELAFDDRALAQVPKVEILEAGIPCSGASRAGVAKRGLKHPEEHPEVGHLVVSALILLNKAAPAVVLIENVVTYATSASASILRTQLRDLGYTTHERVLRGKEWGAIDNRERWCMVAVTHGISFDFDQLMPPDTLPRELSEILDPIGPDDSRWSTMQGLKDKQVRDKAEGKNFKMQIFDASDTSIGTLTKGYSRVRSTDPKLRHPTNPELLRQFTPAEHARMKTIPAHLLEGASDTVQHEMAGQSVIWEQFVDVGQHAGNALNRVVGKPEVSRRPVVTVSDPPAVRAAKERFLAENAKLIPDDYMPASSGVPQAPIRKLRFS